MKILLVKPKPRLATIIRLRPLIFLEPLELGYVAAAVPPGHEVRVLDLRLSCHPEVDFVGALRRDQPDVVGLSGYTHEVAAVVELAQTVRRELPSARVVVGGHHATVLPHDYDLACIDAVVRGEGCAPFRALVEAFARDAGAGGIEHVLVPGPEFDAAAAARMPRYPDLSSLPLPRRDLWDPAPYQCIWPSEEHPPWKTIFPPVALVRTSFGCLMNCSFCMVPSLSGRRHLTRPPEEVVDEIAGLPQEHVYFCDDETFLDADHARKVAELLGERGVRKRYFAWARSTTVNRRPELFRAWREVGLDAVFLGFEAITDAALDRLSKHSSVADNERAHRTLRSLGIAVQAGFMVNADFTRDDFRSLQDYLRRMPPAQITCTVLTPSPGSPAWRDERSLYVCGSLALHDCMHPLIPTAIPKKDFFRQFATLSTIGASRNPLRTNGARIPVRDLLRILLAARGYSKALRRAWRDY